MSSYVLQRMFPPLLNKLSDGERNQKNSYLVKETILGSKFLCQETRLVLYGPNPSDNAALLFQCAVSFAMEGHTVIFITQEKLMSLPIAVEGSQKPDPRLMKQIIIKYFSNRSSLLLELTQIHSANPAPDIIIVDNLDFYISNPKTNSICQVTAALCAHLIDAATYLASKRAKTEPLSASLVPTCVLASISTSASGSFIPSMDVYKKFFPFTFTVTDLEDANNLKQLQCWIVDEELPQYVITVEVTDTIRIKDVMKGSELDADWSQPYESVT
ncbi:uncharacterized protein [Apostichopus japonicus]|uniref:uncharacterized protein n=1 Tax=Stichopus japonicus TaxID=307972 RepID=UPI003AB8FBD5